MNGSPLRLTQAGVLLLPGVFSNCASSRLFFAPMSFPPVLYAGAPSPCVNLTVSRHFFCLYSILDPSAWSQGKLTIRGAGSVRKKDNGRLPGWRNISGGISPPAPSGGWRSGLMRLRFHLMCPGIFSARREK